MRAGSVKTLPRRSQGFGLLPIRVATNDGGRAGGRTDARPAAPNRRSLLCAGDDDDRAVCVVDHLAGHGAQAEPGESAAAAVTDDDQIAVR